MKHPRRALHLSLLLLCLAVGAAIFAGFQEPHGPIQRLPDGTTLELIAVTYGTHHEIAVGNWYQRTFGPWWSDLSKRVRNAISPRGQGAAPIVLMGTGGGPLIDRWRASLDSKQDEPVLWFRIRTPAVLRSNRTALGGLGSATFDAHGCRLPCNPSWQQSVLLGTPLSTSMPTDIAVMEVPNYPRRQPWFEFALFADDEKKPVATFHVRNPKPFSTKPQTLITPVLSATNAGVTFTIEGLPRKSSSGDFVFRYRAAVRGKADRSWRVRSVTIRDGTGNEQSESRQADDETMHVPGLCVHEPAWTLEADFIDEDPVSAPDYVWSFRHLPVPPRGRYLEYRGAQPQGVFKCRLFGVGGTGHVRMGGITYTRPLPQMLVGSMPNTTMQVAVRSVRDERGRTIRTVPDQRATNVDEEGVFVSLPPLGPTHWFDLELCGSRTRRVKFVVRP